MRTSNNHGFTGPPPSSSSISSAQECQLEDEPSIVAATTYLHVDLLDGEASVATGGVDLLDGRARVATGVGGEHTQVPFMVAVLLASFRISLFIPSSFNLG
ncbi:hypothetical protein SORBI_3002G081050 [Sorghum bicolor]|jgi:hypothetical protein|uniref:Uncharacterized protein n=1 Tax=Sorghum bicolor TaxID=4558 RepID=A0A1W0W2X5_SORBI|nr:hypothetical protein SORBI_3002G081050 [Sorghum bicolor]